MPDDKQATRLTGGRRGSKESRKSRDNKYDGPAPESDPARSGGGIPGEPTGPRRALIGIYATFALAATARAGVQLATRFHEAPLAYVLSLVSGIIYIGATVGLTTRRPWSRGLAWASCATELVGVLAIGTLSIVDAIAFNDASVWSNFGSGYVYIPVVLPLLGLGWLWHTVPRRLLAAAADTPSKQRDPGQAHHDGAG